MALSIFNIVLFKITYLNFDIYALYNIMYTNKRNKIFHMDTMLIQL